MEIIKIINKISHSKNTKICFSSRPWNVFENAYSEIGGHRIRLQDLTRRDIDIYVTETLVQDQRFQQIETVGGHHTDLVDEIISRASGVLLWVVLVVRSLLRGLTNHDTTTELQSRLGSLPTDVEAYFRDTLHSGERVYDKQAARLYLLCLSRAISFPIMTASYFDEEDPTFALKLDVKPWTLIELQQRCTITEKHVLARCTDLLEINKHFGLDFLHSTVYDFMQTPDILALLQKRAGQDFRN